MECNTAVITAGAFPLLKQLLYSRNQKVVSGAVRSIKILLEGNPNASHHIFRRDNDNDTDMLPENNAVGVAKKPSVAGQSCGGSTPTVERLMQLIAEGQQGTADVAALLLARACQTREQQVEILKNQRHIKSTMRTGDSTDGQEFLSAHAFAFSHLGND